VRIEDVRERVHEVLEHVVRSDLLAALQHALVALAQHVLRLGPRLVGEHQRHGVVLDALSPELIELRTIRRPGRVLAVELESFFDREIRLDFEQRQRVLDPLRLRGTGCVNAGSTRPVRLVELVAMASVSVSSRGNAARAIEDSVVVGTRHADRPAGSESAEHAADGRARLCDAGLVERGLRPR
jgi:hypothetical protein